MMIKGKTNCYLSKKRKKTPMFLKKSVKGDALSFMFLPRLVREIVSLTLMVAAEKIYVNRKFLLLF